MKKRSCIRECLGNQFSRFSFVLLILFISGCDNTQLNEDAGITLNEAPPTADESMSIDPAVFLEAGLTSEITE
ncbi:MAG: hypothetical protein AAFP03_03035, partial [Cyanobacteria bacterium J06598_3]